MMADNVSSNSNVLELIDDSKTVLVVGPIVVNETIHGVCKRIASDFPIPVFEKTRTVYDIGGPGNLVKNIKAMCLGVDLITMIGESDDYVVDTMKNQGIDITGTVTSPGYTVAKKIRYMCNGYNSFRANEGNEDFEVDAETELKILSTVNQKLEAVHYDVIVLSDYRFGMLSDRVSSSIITQARAKGIPVVVDPPKFGDFSKFKGCTIFKPNLDEAKYFLGRDIKSKQQIEIACKDICEKLGSDLTIITLAEGGIAAYSKPLNNLSLHPVQQDPNVVDVNGAGDTVLAVIAFGIAHKMDVDDMCKLANDCAGNVIQKPGTVPVNLIEIIGDKSNVIKSKREVVNLHKLIPDSEVITLINGQFKPITISHLKSIKHNKGKWNIVLVAIDRIDTNDELELISEILVCNKFVDFVILLDEFDKEFITETLKPTNIIELN